MAYVGPMAVILTDERPNLCERRGVLEGLLHDAEATRPVTESEPKLARPAHDDPEPSSLPR